MKTFKIAIAGASGFVGRYLVPYLLKQGHQVLGLTRSPRKEQTHENFSWVACDLFSYKDKTMKPCKLGSFFVAVVNHAISPVLTRLRFDHPWALNLAYKTHTRARHPHAYFKLWAERHVLKILT